LGPKERVLRKPFMIIELVEVASALMDQRGQGLNMASA
jgi:hypothetical protein